MKWQGIQLVVDPRVPPNSIYYSTTSAAGTGSWNEDTASARFSRRGVPRHLALVWLEREDEPIPAPWADFVMRRFFHHATASHGVIIESPDIPWGTHPGHHLLPFPSWEALDIEVRRVTLQRVADVLPNPQWSEEADKDPLHQYQKLQNQQAITLQALQQLYCLTPLSDSAPNVILTK